MEGFMKNALNEVGEKKLILEAIEEIGLESGLKFDELTGELFQDEELFLHSKKVAYYSLCLFNSLQTVYGLNDSDRKYLFLSALLHDVGKLQIPREVLYKPVEVTEEEYELLKKHAVFSSEVLSKNDYFTRIVPNVLHHHEHYDGSGYPHGLASNNIPLFSRIISVADAFDAMTSPRCYRKPRSPDCAIGEILENSGTQFDPNIAEFFINIYKMKRMSIGWVF
jgi:HD-GYP domain-containing protein (c-di-GMP phosphodiesterase class II)